MERKDFFKKTIDKILFSLNKKQLTLQNIK